MNHPEAIRRTNEMDTAERKFDEAKKRIKNIYDPTRKRAERDAQEAERAYDDLWETMYPILSQRVQRRPAGQRRRARSGGHHRGAEPQHGQLDLKKIKLNEKLLEEQIKEASVEVKQGQQRDLGRPVRQGGADRPEGHPATVTKHKDELDLRGRPGRADQADRQGQPDAVPLGRQPHQGRWPRPCS